NKAPDPNIAAEPTRPSGGTRSRLGPWRPSIPVAVKRLLYLLDIHAQRQRGVGWKRLVRHSLFRDNSNRVDLNVEIRVGQPGNQEHRHGRRIGSVAPRALECLKARLNRLALHDVHIPLNYVLQLGPARRQRGFNILKDLFGLGLEVFLADDLARGVHGILAADVNGLGIARYDDRLAVSRVLVQAIWVEVLHASRHRGVSLILVPVAAPSKHARKDGPRAKSGSC